MNEREMQPKLIGSLEIEWRGEPLRLRSDRSLVWPRERAVFITDPHFGKASSFRAQGVPVPAGTTISDLDRLSRMVEEEQARTLIVLGDFFHARDGLTARTLESLIAWRERHAALDVLIVRGNHDHHAGDPPAGFLARIVDEPFPFGPFTLAHHPSESPCAGELAGHLHPCIVLRGAAGFGLRTPCFVFGEQQGLLPAFGGFTGGHVHDPAPNDRVFAIGPDRVVEVTAAVTGRPARHPVS